MKLLTIISGLLILGSVNAAEADNRNWTGAYAGADATLAFNEVQMGSQQLGFTQPSNVCNENADYSTFSPGIQLGYVTQAANDVVTGVELNTTMSSDQTHSLACHSAFNAGVYDRFTLRNQTQISLKGRLGRATVWHEKAILPYLAVGASLAKLSLAYLNEGGNYFHNTNSALGWLIGAGVEWAFKTNWSLRLEYSYVHYPNAINLQLPTVYGLNDPNGNANTDLSANNIDFSINYWV